MKFTAFAATAMVVATTLSGEAQGFMEVGDISDKLNIPLPKEMKRYFKQGAPFVKMFQAKLKTEECKEKIGDLYKNVLNDAESDMTVRDVMQRLCEVGDDCFSESTDSVKKLVAQNKLLDTAAKTFLEQNAPGVDIDTLISGAPILYIGVCSSLEEKEEL